MAVVIAGGRGSSNPSGRGIRFAPSCQRRGREIATVAGRGVAGLRFADLSPAGHHDV